MLSNNIIIIIIILWIILKTSRKYFSQIMNLVRTMSMKHNIFYSSRNWDVFHALLHECTNVNRLYTREFFLLFISFRYFFFGASNWKNFLISIFWKIMITVAHSSWQWILLDRRKIILQWKMGSNHAEKMFLELRENTFQFFEKKSLAFIYCKINNLGLNL